MNRPTPFFLNKILRFSFILIIACFFIPVTEPVSALTLNVEDAGERGELIDINSATQEELETINGISSATAKKIISERPYKSVDELSHAGLNDSVLEYVKPFITAGDGSVGDVEKESSSHFKKPKNDLKKNVSVKIPPGTKIDINKADRTALEKLPAVGRVKAKAIIDGRPYNSIEDIMKVKGIKIKIFNAIKDYIVVR